MIKGYKYRIYPNRKQAETLLGWMEMQRRLWNFSVSDREKAWKEREESLRWISKKHPELSQCRHLTKSRAIYPELAAVPVSAQQALLKRVDTAFQNFFRRIKKGEKPGYPRYKKPGNFPSLVWEGASSRKWLRDGRLSIPKLGEMKIVLHRPLPFGYTMKTVTISCVAGVKWYVSLGHENHVLAPEKIDPQRIIGIDVGLISYVALSDGGHYDKPNFYKEARHKRIKLQRQLAKKKKGSNNYRKAKQKMSLARHDEANARRYFQQTLAREIVDAYDLIVVENLNIKELQEQKVGTTKAMSSQRKACGDHSTSGPMKQEPPCVRGDRRMRKGLHRNIADAGWGNFLWMLEYKAEEEGKYFVKVPPRGTTQKCSQCGAIVPKTLRDRMHSCPYCGLIIDRDVNAARNILARGLDQLGLCRPDEKPVEDTAMAVL